MLLAISGYIFHIYVASGGHPGVPGCSCLSFSGILVGYFGLAHVRHAASDVHYLSLRHCIISDAMTSRLL